MPITTRCTCSMSLTGFCARDIKECKQLFLTEMDNCYNYEDMEEKKTQNCPLCGTPCEVIDEPYQGDKTVDEVWESFWKPIVSNEDGTINIEQVKKELADFSFIMEQVPKVYCHITGNKMSKVMYRADTVITVADDYFQEQLEEAVKVEVGEQQGAVWVRAMDRLPGVRTEVKWRIDGVEWEAKETPLGMWYNKPNDFNKYEWLDESGTAAEGREEDAVKFAEWVSASFVGFYVGRELNHWYCPTLNGQEGKYTTADLYELFKQQNEK